MLITNWLLPLVLTLSSDGKPTPTKDFCFDPIEITEKIASPGHLAFVGKQTSRVYSDLYEYLENVRFIHQSRAIGPGREWIAYTFLDWAKPSWIRFFFCAQENESYMALTLDVAGLRIQYLTGWEWDDPKEFASVTKLTFLFKKIIFNDLRIGFDLFFRNVVLQQISNRSDFESPGVTLYFPRKGWKVRLGLVGVTYTAAL